MVPVPWFSDAEIADRRPIGCEAWNGTQMNQTPPDPERLVEDLAMRWGARERVLVESYLSFDPALRDTPEVLLDLIYQEVVLREQHGRDAHARRVQGAVPRAGFPAREAV